MPGGVKGFDPQLSDNAGTSALSWMAHELVKDPRFVRGSVYFWYESIFGRAPLVAPIPPDRPDDANDSGYQQLLLVYQQELQTFQTQDEWLSTVAENFGATGYIVRDLLVELLTSEWYRARAVDSSAVAQDDSNLYTAGAGRLHTLEELDASTQPLFDESTVKYPQALFPDLYSKIGFLYSGFSGGDEAPRNESITSLMSVVLDSRINTLICRNRLVSAEFDLAKADRYLLKFVEPEDLPSEQSAKQRIRENIQYLFLRLLGEFVALDDDEVEHTLALFEKVLNTTRNTTDVGIVCEGARLREDGTRTDDDADPFGTRRAWKVVIAYLLSDFEYVHN
jgi:hypothetical protein